MADVAILGTGRMGAAMARKLAESGHSVTLWNRTPSAAEAVAADSGADVAPTAAHAVAGADVVIAMLASGEVTTSVLLDEAVLSALRPGTSVCDMSTSGVEAAKALDGVLTPAGVLFVDIGTSAGLTTLLPHYAYRYDAGPTVGSGPARTPAGCRSPASRSTPTPLDPAGSSSSLRE